MSKMSVMYVVSLPVRLHSASMSLAIISVLQMRNLMMSRLHKLRWNPMNYITFKQLYNQLALPQTFPINHPLAGHPHCMGKEAGCQTHGRWKKVKSRGPYEDSQTCRCRACRTSNTSSPLRDTSKRRVNCRRCASSSTLETEVTISNFSKLASLANLQYEAFSLPGPSPSFVLFKFH